MNVRHFFAGEPQTLTANRASIAPNINTADFSGALTGVFQWLIVIAGVLAAVFLVMAGFQYMTTDAFSAKGAAKKRIQEIFIGLALALSSVLILQTINPAIVNFDLSKIGGGSRIGGSKDASLNGSNYIIADGGQHVTAGNHSPTNTPFKPGESGQLSTEQVQALWDQHNIRINNPDRTSVNGLRQITALNVASMVQELELDGLIITGGTESGHTSGTYSHANGYKVDIGYNSNRDNWERISSYFNNMMGTTIQPNKVYEAQTDTQTVRVILHDPLHYDVQYIPKTNP
jgi:hypothetical protein